MTGDSQPIDPSEVHAAVDRIFASRGFRSSQRLQHFLTFVVERKLAGREEEIKEYIIATEVYKKPSDYDPHVDSSVRVEATRLRARLREYYEGAGRNERLRIRLPRGRYVPVLELLSEPTPADVGDPGPPPAPLGRKRAVAGAP